jgi:metal-dependent amidase/aminoacylase/carboxypeptidase family protein
VRCWYSLRLPLRLFGVRCWQPAEEGGGGADVMAKAGVLSNPEVAEIFGLHLWNYSDLGAVGVRHGPMMASSCRCVAADVMV